MGLLLDSSTNISEDALVTVNGGRGIGRYFLDLQLELRFNAWKDKYSEVFLHGLWAKVEAECAGGTGELGRVLCGDLIGRRLYDRAATERPVIHLELDAGTINALEELRQNEDFKLVIYLECEIERRATPEGNAPSERGLPHQQPYAKAYETIRRAVNQSEWVKALEGMGYSRRMLLEVPALDDILDPSLAPATEYLRSAQRRLYNGEFRETVDSARHVLDIVSKYLDDEDQSASFNNCREKSKEERFQLVRRSLRVLGDLAHHPESTAVKPEWTRADALAMLHMLSTVLFLAEKRRTDHESLSNS